MEFMLTIQSFNLNNNIYYLYVNSNWKMTDWMSNSARHDLHCCRKGTKLSLAHLKLNTYCLKVFNCVFQLVDLWNWLVIMYDKDLMSISVVQRKLHIDKYLHKSTFPFGEKKWMSLNPKYQYKLILRQDFNTYQKMKTCCRLFYFLNQTGIQTCTLHHHRHIKTKELFSILVPTNQNHTLTQRELPGELLHHCICNLNYLTLSIILKVFYS